MFFKKRNVYEIDMIQANNTLQNVFAACNQAPNTIPFDKLVLRNQLDTKIYNRLLIITSIALLFTFLSPLFIVPASEMMDHLHLLLSP